MIVIFGKSFNQSNVAYAQEMFDYLHKKKLKYVIEKKFLHILQHEKQKESWSELQVQEEQKLIVLEHLVLNLQCRY